MKRILYLVGTRHCGSTIVDLALGEHPQMFSLGQAASAFLVFDGTERCVCDADPRECPVWGPAFAALSPADRLVVNSAGRKVLRERRLVRFLASRSDCAVYQEPFDRMFDGLFESTGAEVLIDSSKNVTRAVALLRASRYPVHVLHLVRDCRGLLNSYASRDGSAREGRTIVEWMAKNTAASTAVRALSGPRYLAMRFEDLLLDPEASLARIGEFVDLDLAPITSLIREPRLLGPRHIFRGNQRVKDRPLVIDPSRLRDQALASDDNRRYWRRAGFVTALWGYDRGQHYLDRVPA